MTKYFYHLKTKDVITLRVPTVRTEDSLKVAIQPYLDKGYTEVSEADGQKYIKEKLHSIQEEAQKKQQKSTQASDLPSQSAPSNEPIRANIEEMAEATFNSLLEKRNKLVTLADKNHIEANILLDLPDKLPKSDTPKKLTKTGEKMKKVWIEEQIKNISAMKESGPLATSDSN